MEAPEFLNAKEAAAYMKTSVGTIYCLAGYAFPVYKPNSRLLIDKKDLVEYIQKHKVMYRK